MTISSPGGVSYEAFLPPTRRRAMYPDSAVNYIPESTAPGVVTTLGTVVNAGTKPRRITCTATSSGSTARILAGWVLTTPTLTNGHLYEFSATVESASIANTAVMSKTWLGTSGEGQGKSFPSDIPVAGIRYGYRFNFNSSQYLRIGFGCPAAETVVNGDVIVFKDIALYEVSSLTGSVLPYIDVNSYGPVGYASSVSDSLGSCVLFCGDSWFNNVGDIPGLIGNTYRRECVVSATAGHTLTQISAALTSAVSSGLSYLNLPNCNVPGIAVLEGGINDLVGGVTGAAMWNLMNAMLTKCVAMRMVPIVILPTLSTSSSYYTAERNTENLAYRKSVFESGFDFLDSAEICLNLDGTANTIYLSSEGGIYIHPTSDGYLVLARELEKTIRNVERAFVSGKRGQIWA